MRKQSDNNEIQYFGGGIFCSGKTKLINCVITGNYSYRYGGGVSCNENATITNCLIYNNRAELGGGGIYCRFHTGIIENSTINGNISKSQGGGIFSYGISPKVINCILWENALKEVYVDSLSIEITYSDVQGGWQGIGNIDADPRFKGIAYKQLDFPIEKYKLLPDSPCIDTGFPASNVPFGGGCRIDMGAYEFYKGFNCQGENILEPKSNRWVFK